MPGNTAARVGVAVLWIASCLSPSAQPVFNGAEVFPNEEFAARRAKVAEQIGEAVAILLGAAERPGEQAFRQNNQFFYLTGVAQPRAIVAIDGRSKKTTCDDKDFPRRVRAIRAI